MAIKNCVICGKEFEARTNSRVCDDPTHPGANRRLIGLRHAKRRLAIRGPIIKLCAVCGNEFAAKGSHVTCSKICSEKRNRHLKAFSAKQRRKANPEKSKKNERIYRDKNRATLRERAKLKARHYRDTRPGHLRKLNRLSRERHLNRRREGDRQYYVKNRDIILSKLRMKYDPIKNLVSYRRKQDRKRQSELLFVMEQLKKESTMSKSKWNNWTNEALNKELFSIVCDTAERIQRAAEILVELRSRGEHHPLMLDGVLRHFREIADGRLSPLVAFGFAGFPALLAKLKEIPLKEQEAIVHGKPITLAEKDPKSGKVIARDYSPRELRKEGLDRAFKKGGLRPFTEQRKLLNVSSAPSFRSTTRSLPKVRADTRTGMLFVGSTGVSMSELMKPLGELGWKLVRIDAGKKRVA